MMSFAWLVKDRTGCPFWDAREGARILDRRAQITFSCCFFALRFDEGVSISKR